MFTVIAQTNDFILILAMHSSSSFSFEKVIKSRETAKPITAISSNQLPLSVTERKLNQPKVSPPINAIALDGRKATSPSNRQYKPNIEQGTANNQPTFLYLFGNK